MMLNLRYALMAGCLLCFQGCVTPPAQHTNDELMAQDTCLQVDEACAHSVLPDSH